MDAGVPVTRGSYLLIARLETAAEIAVGRLGTFVFAAGWYAYAGSALGPGGLRARLERHRRADKRLHWHIDYLLQESVVEAGWYLASVDRLECAWAAALAGLSGHRQIPPRFGASDCRCPGHLVYCPVRPLDQQIVDALQAAGVLRGAQDGACPLQCERYVTSTSL
jgi:Uri superfamily endonuclease